MSDDVEREYARARRAVLRLETKAWPSPKKAPVLDRVVDALFEAVDALNALERSGEPGAAHAAEACNTIVEAAKLISKGAIQ